MLASALLAALVLAQGDEVAAARGVLARTLGAERAASIELRLIPPVAGGDVFRHGAQGGTLRIEGSSAVALCRGAYDYLRSQRMGTVGWAGPRLDLPTSWPDSPPTEGATPFAIRHAYNAVTSGYTTPFWDWERWEQELDWLALHGFDMAMAPVATEAIATRVWRDLGLTDEEIAAFHTGPAHLPWLRMGCIQDVGGDLDEAWHRDQVALQKRLLARMRELGIEPVVQGFAGFVPRGLGRLHPEVELHETLWNPGFPPAQRPVVMLPDAPLWAQVAERFIARWKEEFGEARYWLVDSFNELQLPATGEPPERMLARYGRATFEAIRAGDADAVWVLQGWMFNYQRDIWNERTVQALVESVPPDDLLVLDYANDYDTNWDDFSAFHGRSWVMGYVPNMGGKTAYTGRMGFYARQVAATLASEGKGHLVGFTVSGEGLENNEVLYELMSDSAWSAGPIDLDRWLAAYAANRYGSEHAALLRAWQALREGVYDSFTPHPTFGWQQLRLGPGSVYREADFPAAVQVFLAAAEELDAQPNYRDDALEMAALALGLRADDWLALAAEAHEAGDAARFERAVDAALDQLMKADLLLESHSLHRLERWLDLTRRHGGGRGELGAWERSARQILSVWGPPVNDYACRVWSGLIRDFYVPRLRAWTAALGRGEAFDRARWEAAWVGARGVSKVRVLERPTVQAALWVREAYAEPVVGR